MYAIPDHNQGERLRYAHNNLWHFKYSTDKKDRFDSVLESIHNLSLTAEVPCFCKASHLFFQYQEEICKLKECMWEASQLKDASGCRMEGADALHRIEEALGELNCRAERRQVLTEHGCGSGPIMTLVFCAGTPLPSLLVTMQGT